MSGCAAEDHHSQPNVLSRRREIGAGALGEESRRHLGASARRQGRGSVAEAIRAIGGPYRRVDLLKLGPAGGER